MRLRRILTTTLLAAAALLTAAGAALAQYQYDPPYGGGGSTPPLYASTPWAVYWSGWSHRAQIDYYRYPGPNPWPGLVTLDEYHGGTLYRGYVTTSKTTTSAITYNLTAGFLLSRAYPDGQGGLLTWDGEEVVGAEMAVTQGANTIWDWVTVTDWYRDWVSDCVLSSVGDDGAGYGTMQEVFGPDMT